MPYFRHLKNGEFQERYARAMEWGENSPFLTVKKQCSIIRSHVFNMEITCHRKAKKVRPLPETIAKNNLFLRQVKRTDRVAIYSVRETATKPICSYEVWLVKIAPAQTATFAGKRVSLPERERVPTNESFGSWAWSWATRAQAESCFTLHVTGKRAIRSSTSIVESTSNHPSNQCGDV
jgi:hypothetical protein